MIPEVSHFLLISSAGLFLFSGINSMFQREIYSNSSIRTLNINTFNLGIFLMIASFVIFIFLVLNDDFSLLYIYSHSHSDLPTFYKISSIWSAHEGSMFLWIIFLSIWCWLFVNKLDRTHELLKLFIMISSFIIFTFLVFLLTTSSPFERLLPYSPDQGNDINPILQDPALAIHPPMLFLGYVGFVIPFIFLLAYLINGNFQFLWEREVRKWCFIAWVFLTTGIGLGSWWAYYELGWGGYWFWDPVENVALMPWLAATAFIHSLYASIKSNVLKSWTIFLGLIVFSLTLFGAFIVRSGIIDSVHAFANDPERGLYLLMFSGVISISALCMFAYRFPKIISPRLIVRGSKESFLSLNNIFMITAVFSIFLGITYPLIFEYLNDARISVGPPYYNTIFAPLILISSWFIVISLDANWQRFVGPIKILKKSLFLAIFSGFICLMINYISSIHISIIENIGLFAGSLILLRYLYEIIMKLITPRYINIPSLLSHIGFGLLLLSISLNSIFSFEKNFQLNLIENYQFDVVSISLNSMDVRDASNFQSIVASVTLIDGSKKYLLQPEKRKYFARDQVTSETDIRSTFIKDIYINLGEQLDNGAWTFKLRFNYFISWLWFSVFMMILGVLVHIRSVADD